MCRFLDSDGHCAFHSNEEVKEYCVAGPCPDEQDYDELVKALQTDIREVEDDPVNTLRLMWRAADAIERLMAEVEQMKDELILRQLLHNVNKVNMKENNESL